MAEKERHIYHHRGGERMGGVGGEIGVGGGEIGVGGGESRKLIGGIESMHVTPRSKCIINNTHRSHHSSISSSEGSDVSDCSSSFSSSSSSSDGCYKNYRNGKQQKYEKVSTEEKKNMHSKNNSKMNLRNDGFKIHRRNVYKPLLIDSRDRIISTYPSANNFDIFLGDTLKNVKSMELISALIPIPNGFADRYVVIAEEHCSDSMLIANRIPFGYDNTVPGNYRTGCSFPNGSFAMIQLVPNAFTNTAVSWTNVNIGKSWTCKFDTSLVKLDRLSFSLWSWNVTGISSLYPLLAELPPPVVPNVNNNVIFVFRMKYN
jgi:hypothetical protein